VKANIPEMVSSGTQAGIRSRRKIENSIDEIKKFLNIDNHINWTGTFYQYTNRIAHLSYLRQKNKIKTNLSLLQRKMSLK